MKYDCLEFGLFFKSTSRLIRIIKAANVLTKTVRIGETDVQRKLYPIIMGVVIIIYITAGMFMVIENF